MRKIAIWGMAVILVVSLAGVAGAASVRLDPFEFNGVVPIQIRNQYSVNSIPNPNPGPPSPYGISTDTPSTTTGPNLTYADGLIYNVALRLHDVVSRNPGVAGFIGYIFKGWVDILILSTTDPATGLNVPLVAPVGAFWVYNIPCHGIQTGAAFPAAVAWTFTTTNRPAATTTNPATNNSVLGTLQGRGFSCGSVYQLRTGTFIPILQSTFTITGFGSGPGRLTGSTNLGPVAPFPVPTTP